jgi:acetyl-CoA acetyltransferase
LCARGDSAQLVRNGDTARGGRWPVNLSGGLLSKGEPLGASALAQIIELSNQIDGRAGVRQIENAQVGLAHTVGRGANAAVVIITK